jgi:hypothetical protein
VSTLPTFLVIGAAKAGTTAVYDYLRQHPQVFMSAVKEPYFFALEGEPIAFGGPVADMPINRVAVNDAGRYRALFAGGEAFAARGEASAGYLYSPRAPERIARHVPDVRLVAVLRDPVERAYSSYLYQVARGLERAPTFAEALADEPRRIAENWPPLWHYRRMGFYGAQLERYYATFARGQLHVGFHEDLAGDPRAFMRELYAFIGVDSGFAPDTRVAPNPSGVPRRPGLHRLLLGSGALKTVLKRTLPRSWTARAAGRVRRSNLVRPPLDAAVAAALRAEYADDLRRVETLTGRDLTRWRTGQTS